MFGVIKGGGAGGRSPPAKQGGLRGRHGSQWWETIALNPSSPGAKDIINPCIGVIGRLPYIYIYIYVWWRVGKTGRTVGQDFRLDGMGIILNSLSHHNLVRRNLSSLKCSINVSTNTVSIPCRFLNGSLVILRIFGGCNQILPILDNLFILGATSRSRNESE